MLFMNKPCLVCLSSVQYKYVIGFAHWEKNIRNRGSGTYLIGQFLSLGVLARFLTNYKTHVHAKFIKFDFLSEKKRLLQHACLAARNSYGA